METGLLKLKLDTETRDAIAASLQTYFYNLDDPPADNIIVYKDSIKPYWENPAFLSATVKIIVNYIVPKSHKVNIKFKITKTNRVIANSVKYVNL